MTVSPKQVGLAQKFLDLHHPPAPSVPPGTGGPKRVSKTHPDTFKKLDLWSNLRRPIEKKHGCPNLELLRVPMGSPRRPESKIPGFDVDLVQSPLRRRLQPSFPSRVGAAAVVPNSASRALGRSVTVRVGS